MNCDGNTSLNVNYPHQIDQTKFNLQVYCPSPYEKPVWHHIRRAISGFNWERSFPNKDVNEMDNIFNETISNVLSNYIPHETIICDDQDHQWINNKVEKQYKKKKSAFQQR